MGRTGTKCGERWRRFAPRSRRVKGERGGFPGSKFSSGMKARGWRQPVRSHSTGSHSAPDPLQSPHRGSPFIRSALPCPRASPPRLQKIVWQRIGRLELLPECCRGKDRGFSNDPERHFHFRILAGSGGGDVVPRSDFFPIPLADDLRRSCRHDPPSMVSARGLKALRADGQGLTRITGSAPWPLISTVWETAV